MNYELKDVLISSIDVWDEAQARKLDIRGISELAKSIQTDGLQNPPLVQKNGDRYTLISGQRRLAAVKSLGKRIIPVLVLKTSKSIDNAKASSLVENIHRQNMNPAETAKAVKFIVQHKGKKAACKILGISARTLERYLGFDAVPDSIKELVPDVLSRDHALKLFRHSKNITEALEAAKLISKYDDAKKGRYLKALADNPDSTHDSVLRKSNRYYTNTFKLDISPKIIQKITSESEKNEMTSEEMISSILKDWFANKSR